MKIFWFALCINQIQGPKCKIISKGLLGILEFSQKQTNKFVVVVETNSFVVVFGRIRGDQKSFRNYLTFSHKNLQNLPHGFEIYLVNVKTVIKILHFLIFSEKLNFI